MEVKRIILIVFTVKAIILNQFYSVSSTELPSNINYSHSQFDSHSYHSEHDPQIDKTYTISNIEYNGLHKIFENLTQHDVYQNWIRPKGICLGDIDSEQNRINVNLSIELYNYATILDQTSEYIFQFFLDMNWCDERLIFDFSKQPNTMNGSPRYNYTHDDIYNFLEGNSYHIQRIWKPSIFVPNNEQPSSINDDGPSPNAMKVDLKTGRVWLRKRNLLNVDCRMDYSYFPFDQQECYVHFQASVDNARNLKLQWGDTVRAKNPLSKDVDLDPIASAESLNWAVYRHSTFRTIGFVIPDKSIKISTSLNVGMSGLNYSRCTFKFVLEREFTQYLITVYFPSALIVVVSWSEFWLEITSPPARIMLGITSMLALLTIFKTAKEQLRSTAMNIMDVWNLVCTIFIVVIVIEFALVNYIHNTGKRSKTFKRLKQQAEKYKRAQESRSRTATIRNMETLNEQSNISESFDLPEPKGGFLNHVKELKDSFIRKITFTKVPNKNIDFEVDQMSNKSRTSTVSFMTPTNKNHLNNTNTNNDLPSAIQRRPSAFGNLQARRAIFSNSHNTHSSIGNQPLSDSRRQSVAMSSAFAKIANRRKSLLIMPNDDCKARFNLTPEQLALSIDRKCRYIFPAAFIIFNILYWMIIFTRNRII